jgi:hypothetical protein
MPAINISVGQEGPVLAAVVSAAVPHHNPVAAAAVMGRFLIDTGANISCIDVGLVATLGLQPVKMMSVSSPMASSQLRNIYQIALLIPAHNRAMNYNLPVVDVLEASVADQGIDGLIGRDLIDQWTCIYNGSTATFTICY